MNLRAVLVGEEIVGHDQLTVNIRIFMSLTNLNYNSLINSDIHFS